MAKVKTLFNCTECGAPSPKWVGQCSSCQAWNTLEETVAKATSGSRESRFDTLAPPAAVRLLIDVNAENISRISTGSVELDRVLGGGLVKGSVVLLGGEPGIGKSTLLLQALHTMSQNQPVLYITGEESVEQIALRAQRLGMDGKRLKLLAENRLEQIMDTLSRESPRVIVIDSIQTLYTDILQSAPGSVAQVRETAAQLVRRAKRDGICMFLVGHVTKEGTLAGPRVLEHMVDTVLYFEGDTSGSFRLIRSMKNRFGAVNEVGVFMMSEAGLQPVTNPSAMFISRHSDNVAGSAVLATWEGTRPLLVEVQALVDDSHVSQPRRVCVGLDSNRLAMLLAMLHRHAGIATFDQDVFVNVVSGLRITETAADLAVLMAVVSSMRDKPLGKDLLIFGEVGLAGEVRPVQRGQDRLREAAKLGFTRALIPHANRPKENIEGIEVIPIRRLHEALDIIS